jgi:hypothetical protein
VPIMDSLRASFNELLAVRMWYLLLVDEAYT